VDRKRGRGKDGVIESVRAREGYRKREVGRERRVIGRVR